MRHKHEKKGKRPALALSPKAYNEKTGLGVF
jgi:mRNA-degrading endonuclease toxin of MazEF toxin-antitoxin module